jgi:hypothetical protein
MIAQINAKPERALRQALASVARMEDQFQAPLAELDEGERAAALGLAVLIACYVMIDVCGSTWPKDSSVRLIANVVSTRGTRAKQLQLDAEEIYAYLSRAVLGPERLEDVIPGEPELTRLPLVVAFQALAVYCPKDIDFWDYLERIESAIEVATTLDARVVPAVVMRAYWPKPDTGI